MALTIEPEIERQIVERTKREGYPSPSAFLRTLMGQPDPRLSSTWPHKPHADSEDRQTDPDWAWQAIEQVAGSASGGLSTDEIMESSRSEV